MDEDDEACSPLSKSGTFAVTLHCFAGQLSEHGLDWKPKTNLRLDL